MRTVFLAAAAVAAVPVGARAVPLNEDFMTVRYEGIVTEVRTRDERDCFCGYQTGDTISGALLVDLRNAPPDLEPSPVFARYAYPDPDAPGRSFVSGFATTHGASLDRVQIGDDPLGDAFEISDTELSVERDSGGPFSEAILNFFIASDTRFDFTHGEGLIQNFELGREQLAEIADGGIAEGSLQVTRRFLNRTARMIQGTVEFALTKVSAKPGRCAWPAHPHP